MAGPLVPRGILGVTREMRRKWAGGGLWHISDPEYRLSAVAGVGRDAQSRKQEEIS